MKLHEGSVKLNMKPLRGGFPGEHFNFIFVIFGRYRVSYLATCLEMLVVRRRLNIFSMSSQMLEILTQQNFRSRAKAKGGNRFIR